MEEGSDSMDCVGHFNDSERRLKMESVSLWTQSEMMWVAILMSCCKLEFYY